MEDNSKTAPVGPERHKPEGGIDLDNLEEELNKIPLFMSDLPEEENDTLAALQALAYDGTPEGKLSLLLLCKTYKA